MKSTTQWFITETGQDIYACGVHGKHEIPQGAYCVPESSTPNAGAEICFFCERERLFDEEPDQVPVVVEPIQKEWREPAQLSADDTAKMRLRDRYIAEAIEGRA